VEIDTQTLNAKQGQRRDYRLRHGRNLLEVRAISADIIRLMRMVVMVTMVVTVSMLMFMSMSALAMRV
jgi:hypothetical protein